MANTNSNPMSISLNPSTSSSVRTSRNSQLNFAPSTSSQRNGKTDFDAALNKATAQINQTQTESTAEVPQEVEYISDKPQTKDIAPQGQNKSVQDAPQQINSNVPENIPPEIQIETPNKIPVTAEVEVPQIVQRDVNVDVPKTFAPEIDTEIKPQIDLTPIDNEVEIPIDTPDTPQLQPELANTAYVIPTNNTETLLIVKSVDDADNVNLMTILPKNDGDKSQAMLDILSGKTWKPADVQASIAPHVVDTDNVQDVANIKVDTPKISNQPQVQNPQQLLQQPQIQIPTNQQSQPQLQIPVENVNNQTPVAQPASTSVEMPQLQNSQQPSQQPQIQIPTNQQSQPQLQIPIENVNNQTPVAQPADIPVETPQLQILDNQPQPKIHTPINQQQPQLQIQQQPLPQPQLQIPVDNANMNQLPATPQPLTPVDNQSELPTQILTQFQSKPLVVTSAQTDNQQQPQLLIQARFQAPVIPVQPEIQQPVQPQQPQVQQQFGAEIQPVVNSLQPQIETKSTVQQSMLDAVATNVHVEANQVSTPVTPVQQLPQQQQFDNQQQQSNQQNLQQTVTNASTGEIQIQQQNSDGEETFIQNLPPILNNTNTVQQPVAQVQTPEAPIPTPREDFNVPAQIVESARMISTDEDTEMVINLKPEHLGNLTLRISVSQNGAVNASFYSDNAQVRAIIENSLVQLRQELNDQGLKVENVQVYAGLSDGGLTNGQGQQAWQQNQQQHNTNRRIDFDTLQEDADALTPVNESDSADGVDYKV